MSPHMGNDFGKDAAEQILAATLTQTALNDQKARGKANAAGVRLWKGRKEPASTAVQSEQERKKSHEPGQACFRGAGLWEQKGGFKTGGYGKFKYLCACHQWKRLRVDKVVQDELFAGLQKTRDKRGLFRYPTIFGGKRDRFVLGRILPQKGWTTSGKTVHRGEEREPRTTQTALDTRQSHLRGGFFA